jgi:hypothetical protein
VRSFLVIVSLFFVANCDAQSRLPKQIPGELTISYNNSGGMLRAYKTITIEGGELSFEELRGGRSEPEKWSAAVGEDEIINLYKVFVDNRFDTIKNDKRNGIVYDAGSETISITAGVGLSFHVTSGKNSPLSGSNLARYQAVAKAIADLTAKYASLRSSEPTIDRTGGSDRYIQGKWRAAGQTGTHAWFMDWTFDNGRFKQVGYPPLQQEGKYKVVERTKNGRLILQLYDQKGTFGEKETTIEIIVDTKANQLSIDNLKPFFRTT